MDRIEVIWVDSTAVANGWDTVEKYLESKDLTCTTLGYLVYEDEDIIMLAMSLDPINNYMNHAYVIPKPCITELKRLKTDHYYDLDSPA